MSNQEAIALLRNLEDTLDSYCELNEEGKTAFRMAIEALSCSENPNNSDCISRKAAIDALENIDCSDGIGISALKCDGVEDAINAINALPSAQPERKWVPCSERLPEEDTEVLISYRYKEGEGDTDHVNIDITSYGTVCFGGREIHTLKEWRQPFDYFHANYEVIAWMPLPTPYREE